jgi:glycosyltransferase involved in cell wall biosynthesis
MTQTNPRVLFIGNFLSASRGSKGASEFVVERLIADGWPVLTASPYTGRVRRLLDITSSILRYHHQFDVADLEVYSGLAFMWAELSTRLLKWLHKPIVLSLHGGGLPEFSRRSPQRVHRLLALANAVTTPSQHILQTFQSLRPDLVYLPNGLDVNQYEFRLRSSPLSRIAWLRAFHEIYNPLMAVGVVSELVKAYPDLHLDMIGPDKADGTLAQVQRAIAQFGLERNITLTGPIPNPDIPQRLQQYDLFINTTRLESFGVAVMEAAAAGLPIVTTDAGELPYLWTHEENALLVPNGDTPAMAHAVARLLREPDLAERLSNNARANAERFDWVNILPAWQQLFLTLAHPPG